MIMNKDSAEADLKIFGNDIIMESNMVLALEAAV